MKFLSLDLIAFGPFTGTIVDLSRGDEGLHILYGPNEAGKSSALRAVEALLFGIEHLTGDNFRHDNPQLRIGATLEHSDGSRLSVIRRKGNKNTLLAPDGTPLSDGALKNYLAGVSKEVFSTLFGLDHRRLSMGAELIGESGGDLGQSLFAAGSGLAGLRQAADSLQKDAEALFKPRGSIQTINRLVTDYRKAKKRSQELSLSSRQWEIHHKALNDARGEREKLVAAIGELEREKSRIQRFREALPILSEIRESKEALGPLESVPLLSPRFSDDRRRALRELDRAKTAGKTAAGHLNRITGQIEALNVPESLLTRDRLITDLHKRLGWHLKAFEDLPGLQGEYKALRTDAASILQDLSPDVHLEKAEILRLPEVRRVRIQELGNRHQTLIDEQVRTQADMDEWALEIKSLTAELKALPAEQNPEFLSSALRRALALGDLDLNLNTAQARLKAEKSAAETACRALPLCSGSLEHIAALPVPGFETADRFAARFAETDHAIAALDRQIVETTEEIERAAQTIQALEKSGSIPTEAELLDCRNRRDRGWELVRRAWLNREDVADDALTLFGETRLDTAYAASVRHADDIADRLRREADRVERMSMLLTEKARKTDALTELNARRNQIADERRRLESDWTSRWAPAAILPQTPREMIAWLKQHENLLAQAARVREYEAQVADLKKTIHENRLILADGLHRLGHPEPEPTEPFGFLVERCQRICEAIETTRRQRKELEKTLLRAGKKHDTCRDRHREATERLSGWKTDWSAAITELGLPGSSTPTQANAVIIRMRSLFEKIDQAAKIQQRIDGIKRDCRDFEAEVATILDQVAPDLREEAAFQAVEILHTRLVRAREDRRTLEALNRERTEKEAQHRESETAVKDLTEKLHIMCKQAGCTAPEELEEIEARSREKQSLTETIRAREAELQRIANAGGLTSEELARKAQQCDVDELTLQLQKVDQDISDQRDTLSQIDSTIGAERRELKAMDGRAEAAEAAEEAQAFLSGIKAHADRYILLRAASAILNREIERYRQANQNPILRRAGDLFAELTLGSFSGLKPAVDAKDNLILVGVRPNGEEVTVEAMSDGTGDQLYLSLRLAGLEKSLRENEPLPFIVDDILVHFDDDRAAATLKVLAQLARQTQVLFFTHHRHLLDLARRHVPENVLFSHQLNGAAAA